MTNTQVPTATRTPLRRTALSLLAALAVSIGSIAVPLAADAAGPKSGVPTSESGIAPQADPYRDARKGGGNAGEF